MAKLEIQIQTRKMLKPSTPTPNHLRSLNLSLFDQMAPPLYVPILFHYLPISEGITEKCGKLQKSLAETLTKFYPLAGRFRKDDLSIHCNDEGAEYVETKVNADLAEFLNQGPKSELLNDLLPTDMTSSPLLGVQVNIFNCGGLVIGINISHILADGFTLGTFVKEWTRVSQTGTTKDCLPSFGRLPSIFPSRVLSGPYISPPTNRDPKIVTHRFVFDASAIAKLKERINSSATFTRPTRVVVVMSLIWKVLAGISSAKHGKSRDSYFLFPINLRGKSNLPSLEHALGNFCVVGVAAFEANQSRKELTDFVNMVGSTARDTSVEIGKASIDDIASDERGVPIGLVSQCTLLQKIVEQNDPLLRQWMTQPVKDTPFKSESVETVLDREPTLNALLMMKRRELPDLPIIDSHMKVVGVLSASDVRCLVEGDFRKLLEPVDKFVYDIRRKQNKPHKFCVRCLPHETLGEAVRKMIQNRVHRVILIDERNKPAGVISMTDIMRSALSARKSC